MSEAHAFDLPRTPVVDSGRVTAVLKRVDIKSLHLPRTNLNH